MEENTKFPDWDEEDIEKSLEKIYQWVIQNIKSQIEWYGKKRKPKRIASQLLRAFSIFFAIIGTLCPLIDATKILDKLVIGQWGYIAFALAAAFIGFDRYFGLSTGWMRFISTQLSLEKLLKEYFK